MKFRSSLLLLKQSTQPLRGLIAWSDQHTYLVHKIPGAPIGWCLNGIEGGHRRANGEISSTGNHGKFTQGKNPIAGAQPKLARAYAHVASGCVGELHRVGHVPRGREIGTRFIRDHQSVHEGRFVGNIDSKTRRKPKPRSRVPTKYFVSRHKDDPLDLSPRAQIDLHPFLLLRGTGDLTVVAKGFWLAWGFVVCRELNLQAVAMFIELPQLI